MEWEEIMSQPEPIIVTERYKVTKAQSDWLKEMNKKYQIPPSSLVRMAIEFLKPKFSNHGATEESIVRVYRDHYKK